MSNVVRAFGAVPQTELQQKMLDKLEALADDIRSGRIVAVAACGVVNDGSVTALWHRAAATHFTLLGSIDSMKHDLLKSLDEDD